MFTASRPEAQKRLTCTPATVSGRPALIAAVLAMSAPWSPTGDTHPSTTSSTRLGSSLMLRESISCISPTIRSTGLVVCREPLLLPLPRGVRRASNTSASVAAMVAITIGQELALRQFGGCYGRRHAGPPAQGLPAGRRAAPADPPGRRPCVLG